MRRRAPAASRAAPQLTSQQLDEAGRLARHLDLVLIDAIGRLQDGALGDLASAQQDSFGDGLLDCPHYTRPEEYQDRKVPGILLSGDHQKIERWRLKQSLGRTWERRPDLLEQVSLDASQEALLQAYKAERDI